MTESNSIHPVVHLVLLPAARVLPVPTITLRPDGGLVM